MAGRVRFPQESQIALTWSIPVSFGGLTTALFRRSRAFAALGGVDVDVFTLDPQENRIARDQMLHERDALFPGVRVNNLYDWLSEHPLPGGTLRLDRDVFTPLEPADGREERDTENGPLRRRVRSNDAGETMQIDHFRPDGSLMLVDRRDCRERGTTGGRSIILCDATGTPVRSWKKIWHLYTAWLDRFTAKKPTFLLVDSKVVARFVAGYERDHVTTIHIVHGSHLDDAGTQIRESRRELFTHLHDFGAVVFPTQGQRDDVRALVGPQPNLAAVPNSLPDISRAENARSGSALVGRLDSIKQVEHAISAIQLANRSLASPTTLDIYGDGIEKQALLDLIDHDPHIRMHGFVPDVQTRLAAASTLLLTSKSEAFALVIGEAMATGCLPIAYDIKYGPSDFIIHRENGWLVAPDDVNALAAAIIESIETPEPQLALMRERAIERAADFSEEAVIAIWAKVIDEARGTEASPTDQSAKQSPSKISGWLRKLTGR